jgi:membrane protease YdiL (CAAX protease family)
LIRARYVGILFYKELLRFLANPALWILLLLFFCLGLLISVSDVILQRNVNLILVEGELPGFLEYADRIEPDLSVYTAAEAAAHRGLKRRVALRFCSNNFEQRLNAGDLPCLEISSAELSNTDLGRLRDLLVKDSFLYLKVRVPLEVRIAAPDGEGAAAEVPEVGMAPLEEPEDLKRMIMALLITVSLNIITFNLFTVTFVEEKQSRTLLAVLLSPVRGAEVAVAKALFFLVPGLALAASLAGVYRPDLLAEPVFWITLVSGAILYMSMSLVLVSFVEKQSTASLICLGYLFFLTSMFILAPRFTALYPIKNHLPENFIFSILSFLFDGTPFPVYRGFFLSFLAVSLVAPLVALRIFTRRMTSRPPPAPAAERRWTIGDCVLILAFCLLFQFVIAPALPGLLRNLPAVAGQRVAGLLVLYLSLFAIPLAVILPVYTRLKFGKPLLQTFLRSAAPGRDFLTGCLWFAVYLAAMLAAGWALYALRPAGLPLETMAALEKVNPRVAFFFRTVLGLLHGLGPGSAVLFFGIVGIAVPLFEEMYFRGCVLTALQDRWGPRTALGVSALAFGALHLNLLLFPLYFVIGILTGMLYQRRGSLLAPVVFHSLNNLVSLAVIVSAV